MNDAAMADAAPVPLALTALGEGAASGAALRPRALQGFATAGGTARLLRRMGEVAREAARALPVDLARAATGADAPGRGVVSLAEGRDPRPGARGVALFVHHSASGRVSGMVLDRLRGHAGRDGLAVVLVSVAERPDPRDLEAAREVCALVVHRRNGGLDFGAWRDLVPEVLRRWPDAEEWMLANDSVLGPVRPMGPVVGALRSGGEGLFGLTESHQAGPHLQSYLLLARGRAAVADLGDFLLAHRPSASKWLVVQRGELRLSRWMAARGHRVAAVFGYARAVREVLADAGERAALLASLPEAVRGPDGLDDAARAAWLMARPVNPTQHLWGGLVRRMGFPFLKTELVRRNPGRLPGVEEGWRALVGPGAPVPVAALEAHLATLR